MISSDGGVSILRLIFAFAIVLSLLGGLGYGLRYIAAKGLLLPKMKNRRLALVESLPLDARHRLAIVSCDGREHLLLLGGQQDIVVAANLPESPTQKTA